MQTFHPGDIVVVKQDIWWLGNPGQDEPDLREGTQLTVLEVLDPDYQEPCGEYDGEDIPLFVQLPNEPSIQFYIWTNLLIPHVQASGATHMNYPTDGKADA